MPNAVLCFENLDRNIQFESTFFERRALRNHMREDVEGDKVDPDASWKFIYEFEMVDFYKPKEETTDKI